MFDRDGRSWRDNHEVGKEYAVGARTVQFHPWFHDSDSST